jgi:MFS family permease
MPGSFIAWYSVSMIAAVSVFSSIDRFAITLMVTPIKADLGLSDTEISLIVGLAYSVLYIFAGLPLARLADRWSRKRILSLALAIWSIGTAACAFTNTFWHMFMARAIVGGGTSVKGPASISWISDLVPARSLPRAYAILNAGVYGGSALALMLMGVLLGWLESTPDVSLGPLGTIRYWQLAFLIIGLPGVAFAIVLMTVPEPSFRAVERKQSVPIRQIGQFIGGHWRVFLPLLLLSATNAIEIAGLSAWRPAFLERTYGWTPEQVGPLLGTSLLISSLLGLFLGAIVAERMAARHDDGYLRSVLVTQVLSLPFLLLSPLAPDPWLSLALITVGATLSTAGSPAQLAAMQVVTPSSIRSQMAGLYLLVNSVIAGAFGPFMIAFFTDTVFGAEDMLRYSLVATVLLMTPLGIYFNWRALKPYGALVRAGVAEFQSAKPA